MKIFNIFESIIAEEESSRMVDACVRAFGEELFVDQLSNALPPEAKREPNTSIENKVAMAIKRYTASDYGPNLKRGLNADFIAKINSLQSCMSSYPEVLVPEGTVYRGLKIKPKQALEMYKKVKGKTQFKMPYKPSTYIESWTTERDIASNFAGYNVYTLIRGYLYRYYDKDRNAPLTDDELTDLKDRINNSILDPIFKLGFIIEHDATPDSFLFKSKYFRLLSDYDNEQETIRIGMNPITCNWSLKNTDDFNYYCRYMAENYDVFAEALAKKFE